MQVIPSLFRRKSTMWNDLCLKDIPLDVILWQFCNYVENSPCPRLDDDYCHLIVLLWIQRHKLCYLISRLAFIHSFLKSLARLHCNLFWAWKFWHYKVQIVVAVEAAAIISSGSSLQLVRKRNQRHCLFIVTIVNLNMRYFRRFFLIVIQWTTLCNRIR